MSHTVVHTHTHTHTHLIRRKVNILRYGLVKREFVADSRYRLVSHKIAVHRKTGARIVAKNTPDLVIKHYT